MTIDPRFPSPPVIAGCVFVPDKITPLSVLDAAGALTSAFRHVFQRDPSRPTLLCMLAQSGLETAKWHADHWDNWLNAKLGKSYQGHFTAFRCNEILNGKLQWFDPYHLQTLFRANVPGDGKPETGHAMGAEQYIRFIGTSTRGAGRPNRYAKAWDAFLAGDPYAAADELGAAGYYTASRELYRNGVVRLYNQFDKELPTTLPTIPPHVHDPIILQPTAGHSKLTNEDLRQRVERLQIPLVVDWNALIDERDSIILDEDERP